MKIAKQNGGSGTPGSGVTAENYVKRAQAFAAQAGAGFVIRAVEGSHGSLEAKQPATEAQWLAWMRYFGDKGILHAFTLRHGVTTVPSEWPEEFDLEAATSDRFAVLRRSPYARMTEADREGMRRRIAAEFRNLSFGIPSGGRKPTYRPSPADLAADYASRPLRASPELLASMGVKAKPRGEPVGLEGKSMNAVKHDAYLHADDRTPESAIKRMDMLAAEVRGSLYGSPAGLMKLRGELSAPELKACLCFLVLLGDYWRAIDAKGIKSPSPEIMGKSEPPDPFSKVGKALSKKERRAVADYASARLAAKSCGAERFEEFWNTVVKEIPPHWVAKMATRRVAAALAEHKERGSRQRRGRR